MNIDESIKILKRDIHKCVQKVAISVRKYADGSCCIGETDYSKADYLRYTDRRYRLCMSLVWQAGDVRCRNQK